MKLAVTYENGEVFQHFGHTEQFKIYEIEDGKVVKEEVIGTNGQGHGSLGAFLQEQGVNTLICGGIGMGAQNALASAGVEFYPGVQGSADEAVQAYLKGELVYNPDAHCDHHDHHEHECNHTHGEEGCCKHEA
ncbi:MAG: NifB/NifX family molybdenum-iron cluster-binding protein [Solobacterium sp.]|nr:NifB/NifX family molybdenum-iron cluster-binding protein [Solobacterium sp.]